MLPLALALILVVRNMSLVDRTPVAAPVPTVPTQQSRVRRPQQSPVAIACPR